jgi:hypothetical protein
MEMKLSQVRFGSTFTFAEGADRVTRFEKGWAKMYSEANRPGIVRTASKNSDPLVRVHP